MSEKADLTAAASHFAFGKNWASYAKLVTESQIEEAVNGLRRLVGPSLEGKRFIDIGCGSGLHALAALRLGAAEVVAIDVDSDSVSTAHRMLESHASGRHWRVLEKSVFDATTDTTGSFDVVYSWGVLHHTGDMVRAVRMAAGLVGPGGMFAFALYRRTKLCEFWKREKKWYSSAGPAGQRAARVIFILAFRAAMALQRRSYREYVSNYGGIRGMDFYHDVHDWLGGWPYESISPPEVQSLMESLGMKIVREFVRSEIPSGLFGSGCDEYVYTRMPG